MVNRSQLSPTEKYLGFKKAHDTFRTYRERGEFLAAYVVAFSIFEDRVRSCYLLAHDLARKSAPPGHSTHYKKVQLLESADLIPKDQANTWRKSGDDRNRILHAAMWAPDAVTDADCTAAITLAKEAERLVKRLKRTLRARAGGQS